MAAARYTSQRCLERSSSLLAAVMVRSYGSCSTVGSASNLKVALIGAASETGKNMALCLKQCSLIDELALHDRCSSVNRIRKDLSRCNTTCMVSDRDDASLDNTLLNAKIVALIVSGTNLSQEACEIERVVPKILQYCPKAFVALVARSVNSLLPMLFERYKRDGRFENDRLFGVLNVFSTQASSFAAQRLGIDPNSVNVPIVGGGCPKTAVPLFSLTTPAATFSAEELHRLRNAMKRADEKVAEKCGEGAWSSTEPFPWPMCAGFAAAKFCVSLCKAMKDEAGVVECAFVRSCLIPGLNYCGAPLRLGPNGIQRHLGLPKVSADECRQLEEAIPLIRKDIKLGEGLALGFGKVSSEVCPEQPRCSALQHYQGDNQKKRSTAA